LANKSIRLTGEELEALYELSRFALRSPTSIEDPDARPLRSAAKKLRSAALDALCKHCRDRFSRRKNGLCDACNLYVHNHGKLPGGDTFVRREYLTFKI
jgi:hypothetical protein